MSGRGKQPDEPEGSDAAEASAGFIMERFGKLEDADRSFDVEYWQRLGDAAIFQAAWELVESYHRDRGMTTDELRLQRSFEHFQRS